MITELILDLIIAINENNLENTKKYVNLINQSKIGDDLTYVLDIHRINLYALDNECFDYVLQNLKNLNRPEDVLLERKKTLLLKNSNPIEIENFILNELNSRTFLNVNDDLFFKALIQLTVNLKDEQKIAKIFNIIRQRINREGEIENGM